MQCIDPTFFKVCKQKFCDRLPPFLVLHELIRMALEQLMFHFNYYYFSQKISKWTSLSWISTTLEIEKGILEWGFSKDVASKIPWKRLYSEGPEVIFLR